MMLVSGFVDGRLLYIIQFPFSHPTFIKKLRKQLKRRFPAGHDIPTEYLRSANFDYRHFVDSKDLKVVYIARKEELDKYKNIS